MKPYLTTWLSHTDHKKVIEVVLKKYEIDSLEGRGGIKREARNVTSWLLRNLCNYTLAEIGFRTGKRDHSCAINSIKRCQGFIDTYPDFKSEIDKLIDEISENT